jgi:hypothetical protein
LFREKKNEEYIDHRSTASAVAALDVDRLAMHAEKETGHCHR